MPLEEKLQKLGDFCHQQTREMKSHLCDSLSDIGLTAVFRVSLDIRQD